jgi:8-oxo-dGTP pyrophosphatase MutT (NUDIX family)
MPSSPRKPLPQPPLKRPGHPPPWDHLPVGDRRAISLDRVRDALTRSSELQIGREPDHTREPWRALLAEGGEVRPAAVLVPLFEEGGETRVILTVRSDQLRSHQGEVAFPGGRLEPGEGVVDAALREAYEEVGLDPALATVVGELAPLPTVASNTVMTPVVATLEERPTLQASPDEVDRVFDVALSDLVAEGAFHEEWWSVPGRPGVSGLPGGEFPVWFFAVADETVWGATARTLVELICLVLGVPVPSSLRAR